MHCIALHWNYCTFPNTLFMPDLTLLLANTALLHRPVSGLRFLHHGPFAYPLWSLTSSLALMKILAMRSNTDNGVVGKLTDQQEAALKQFWKVALPFFSYSSSCSSTITFVSSRRFNLNSSSSLSLPLFSILFVS